MLVDIKELVVFLKKRIEITSNELEKEKILGLNPRVYSLGGKKRAYCEVLHTLYQITPEECDKDIFGYYSTSMSSFIVSFSEAHSGIFKKPIKFKSLTTNKETIATLLKTEFGEFVGVGKNKKYAKLNAVEKALQVNNILNKDHE